MTSELRVYLPGWVVEKLFENTDYGINIRYYQIVGGKPEPYRSEDWYHYSLIVRHPEGTDAADLLNEATRNLKSKHLHTEPKTKSVMKTVNKEAYEQRIEDAVCNCYVAIEFSWNQGKPKVILEVDTDIYPKVKDRLFQEFTELSFARIGVTEGWTYSTKKGTTKFAITNKNY